MDNIKTYIRLDKLMRYLLHGRVGFDAKLKDGKITTLIVSGTKTKVFNQGERDDNDNEQALRFVLDSIFEALKSGKEEMLEFRMFVRDRQIKKIDYKKQYAVPIDN